MYTLALFFFFSVANVYPGSFLDEQPTAMLYAISNAVTMSTLSSKGKVHIFHALFLFHLTSRHCLLAHNLTNKRN